MSLILPYPGKPANGDTLDASIVQANITAIAQAIQSFDASQISPGTLTAAAFAASINPNTLLKENSSNFVSSGCIWSIVSGLQGTMNSGILYVNGLRVSSGGVGSYNFTASHDTYVDIDYNGNLYYQPVANGAASPNLTANAVRVAKIVTNASAITSIVQSGLDSLTNSIYASPNVKSVNNTSAPSLTNSDQNLASCGLSLSFNVPGPVRALVTVNLGISSTTDYEFQPEVYLDGSFYYRDSTPASLSGGASARGVQRSLTTMVLIPAGTHTISAGVFLSAATSPTMVVGAGHLSAFVNGRVTA